jgi:hypothetical protein
MCCSECCHCDVPINEDATEDEGANDDAVREEKAVLASGEPETIPSLT